MPEKVNAKDEKIQLNLTEWEFDVVCKAVIQGNYPGTHIALINKLLEKLRVIETELEK